MHFDIALPAKFGPYRLVRRLGAGGMGTVYLAEDNQLGCQVALKVPKPEISADPPSLQRFQQEARLAQKIHHPCICPVYKVDQINGTHYLTMQLVEGATLDGLVGPDRPWSAKRATELICRVALAVEELHRHKVIHRDLKPHNIMVRANDAPMLMDFGLAYSLGDSRLDLSVSGEPLGSPRYMPPEMISNDKTAQGLPTDVYSLGVILYELLTGVRPFEGNNLANLFYRILNEAPRPPSGHRSDLSPELDVICLKALAKKPNDRFPTMADLAVALDVYLKQTTASAIAAVPAGPEEVATGDPMRVPCPQCGERLRISANYWGMTVRCPRCAWRFEAPAYPAQVDTLLTISGIASMREYHGFISYRRERSTDAAMLLHAQLQMRGLNTFLDVLDTESQQWGVLNQRLMHSIEQIPNFLLILTPTCLDRCRHQEDWLRREIAHAFETHRNVIPILKDGCHFPDADALPPDIRALPGLNSVTYSHENFTAVIDRIERYMRSTLSATI